MGDGGVVNVTLAGGFGLDGDAPTVRERGGESGRERERESERERGRERVKERARQRGRERARKRGLARTWRKNTSMMVPRLRSAFA